MAFWAGKTTIYICVITGITVDFHYAIVLFVFGLLVVLKQWCISPGSHCWCYYPGATREFSEVHDDVIKWKHFSRYWPFVWGIHRSPVNSPHKGQWRRILMFSLICIWINSWVSNREAGDLKRYRTHFDVNVMNCCSFEDQAAVVGHLYHLTIIGSDSGLSPGRCQAVILSLGNKIMWNINQNSHIFIHENAFENLVWNMASILYWPRCVRWPRPRDTCVGEIVHHWSRQWAAAWKASNTNWTNSRVIHYCDVIMDVVSSQTTSLTIVYSTVYSDAN